MHRFTLEKYSSRRPTRYICPRCNDRRKTFARYIDTENGGAYLADHVGKCNRESNCNYHYTPKLYFADNPEIKKQMFARETEARGKTKKRMRKAQPVAAPIVRTVEPFNILAPNALKLSLKGYRENGLARYLFSTIEEKEVDAALRRYLVGTWTRKETVFWQIDHQNRIRTGKLIDYCPYTGRRLKSEFSNNWIHTALKRTGEIDDDFTVSQCFFGEHLLAQEIGKPIGVVEAAKTAVIASIFQPGFVWLSTEGKSNQLDEKLRRLIGWKVVLFPDADAFAEWNETATDVRRSGQDVEVSDVIERLATPEEKAKGFDIADYLLSAKIEEKERIDGIIDLVLGDTNLRLAFEERCSIIEDLHNLSPETVEQPKFLRSIAQHVYFEQQWRQAA